MSRAPSAARSAQTPVPAASAPRPAAQARRHDAEHGEAWEREVDRRIEEVGAGKVDTIPAEQVFADIDAELARRAHARRAPRE